jgi:hypothetical protein
MTATFRPATRRQSTDALETASTLAGMVDSRTMQDPHLKRPASVSAVITAGQFEGMTMSRASHGIDVSKYRSGDAEAA